MSEYELDLLRQRAQEARTQKARRGEFLSNIPIGFVKSDSMLEKDPDERIRRSIDLVLTKFLEFGSARQVLIWFMEHELAIPARTMSGDIRAVPPTATSIVSSPTRFTRVRMPMARPRVWFTAYAGSS